MQTFCTIITSDYIPLAKVLFYSLQKQKPETNLQVLIVDDDNLPSLTNIQFHSAKAITASLLGKRIERKYAHSSSDHFRWALKPLFISYLLQNGFEKVIYVDPDIYFVSNFDFLFEKLNQANILLSPHWSNTNPAVNEYGLYHILRDGLFNGGFIGANSGGLEALNWWAELCHFKMEKNEQSGLYDDQKYLDILPVQFENVEVLRHKGCNLASWNIDTCKREIVDGKLIIADQFEPVFIHFAKETIANVGNQNDKLLNPYLEEYSRLLKNEGFDLEEKLKDIEFSVMNNKLVQLKHGLRLRTRFKRFLYKLSEKI